MDDFPADLMKKPDQGITVQREVAQVMSLGS
jgi:hypothetical protein